MRLSKRRQKVGQQPNNTRLIVRHRPLNANEFRMQRYREKQLEPPGEEDEDEEEEEEEENGESRWGNVRGEIAGRTTRLSWYKEERGRGKRRRWKRLKAKAPCWWR